MSSLLMLLAQEEGGGGGGSAIGGIIGGLFGLAIGVLMIASMWRIFTKAGQPGWAAIVPIYNYIVLLKVAGKPVWWVVLMFIPLVNLVVMLLILSSITRNFGKGMGYTLGLLFLGPVFFPMLAFGDSRYLGPEGGGGQPAFAGGYGAPGGFGGPGGYNG